MVPSNFHPYAGICLEIMAIQKWYTARTIVQSLQTKRYCSEKLEHQYKKGLVTFLQETPLSSNASSIFRLLKSSWLFTFQTIREREKANMQVWLKKDVVFNL